MSSSLQLSRDNIYVRQLSKPIMATFTFTGTDGTADATDWSFNSGNSGLGFDFADQQDYTGATILIGKTITEVKLYLKRSATGPGSAINLTGRIYNADFSSYSESTNTISSDTISRSAYTECTFSFTGHVLLTDDVVVCFWSGGTSPGNCEINCLNSGSTSSGYLQGTSGSITSLNTSAGAKYSRAVITYTGGSSGTRLPPPPIVVHI